MKILKIRSITVLTFLFLNFNLTVGQILLKDIYPGPAAPDHIMLGHIGDKLFFFASTPEGRHLWTSRGDSSNTISAKRLYPIDSVNVFSNEFQITDSLIFFFPRKLTPSNYYLYRSDGTEAGTFKLHMFDKIEIPLSQKLEYTGLGNKFIFVNNTNNGKEIWVSDGTVNGTHRLRDAKNNIVPMDPINLVSTSNKVFFYAMDNAHGYELWCTDGTDEGTHLVQDVFPGTVSSININTSPPGMLNFGDKVYFNAIKDIKIGYELFGSDGTDTGTYLIKDLYKGDYNNSNPKVIASCDSFMLVISRHESGNMVIWRSDGSEAGTWIVYNPKDFIFGTNGKFSCINLGNRTLFNLLTSEFGQELWISDGTMVGTHLLVDISPGTGTGFTGLMKKKDEDVFFVGINNAIGKQLWKFEGKTSKFGVFKEILNKTNQWGFNSIEIVGDYLYTNLYIEPTNIGNEVYKIPLWNETDIQSIEKANYFVYPNPAGIGEVLHFNADVTDVSIYNMLGSMVGNLTIEENAWKLPDGITPGHYVIVYEANGQMHNEILVIE